MDRVFQHGTPATRNNKVYCNSGSTSSAFYAGYPKDIGRTFLTWVCALKYRLGLPRSNPYPALCHMKVAQCPDQLINPSQIY